jgi:hypothetical protein
MTPASAPSPGADYATAVIRIPGSPAIAGFPARSFQVLGVDLTGRRRCCGSVDDFADLSLREMMANLGAPQPPGARRFPREPRASRSRSAAVINGGPDALARVVDKDQSFQMLELGTMPGPRLARNEREPPENLTASMVSRSSMSLMVTEPSNRFNAREPRDPHRRHHCQGAGGQETLLKVSKAPHRVTPLPSNWQSRMSSRSRATVQPQATAQEAHAPCRAEH